VTAALRAATMRYPLTAAAAHSTVGLNGLDVAHRAGRGGDVTLVVVVEVVLRVDGLLVVLVLAR
jgi:hypothetical protein